LSVIHSRWRRQEEWGTMQMPLSCDVMMGTGQEQMWEIDPKCMTCWMEASMLECQIEESELK
jgi:adenosyl cobinamide kinase/adenosyl cobinamide phosphate guanylyltransferase